MISFRMKYEQRYSRLQNDFDHRIELRYQEARMYDPNPFPCFRGVILGCTKYDSLMRSSAIERRINGATRVG